MEATRFSEFHHSLHRPKLIMGIEHKAFGALVMIMVFAFVAKSYWGIPVVAVVYLVFRWVSKREPQFTEIFFRFMDEEHYYDATPRLDDYMNRSKGWGKGIPL
jgi:type IV secretory pathway VirB3-like protein